MQEERSRRRDAGMLQVTERDINALTWMAEQYCLSYDQIQRLLALFSPATPKRPDKVAPSTAQNAIERWLQLGYIDMPQKIIREHPTYVWLSRKGLKDLALPYAYYQPKPSTIRHLYAVNSIRLHLLSYQLSATWIAQRTLRTQREGRHLPDAELRTQSFPLIAIQVVEQQWLAPISLQEQIIALRTLSTRYTRLWCFIHAKSLPALQSALSDASNKTSESSLTDHLVWFSLDAKEISQPVGT